MSTKVNRVHRRIGSIGADNYRPSRYNVAGSVVEVWPTYVKRGRLGH